MGNSKLSTSLLVLLLFGSVACSRCVSVGQDKQLVPLVDGGREMALVIGNSSYSSGTLHNPINDARDMRSALRSKGFTVGDCCNDVSLRELTNTIDNWTASLRNGDIAVFYYSGHGIRVGRVDYIEPIGFFASSEADVPYVAYPIERIVDKMQERGTRANLVILDACRNNPFVISKGSEPGLAGVTAGIGTLIMFAAAEGKTADDNDLGKNSLFTLVLLQELNAGSVNIRSLPFKVRDKVYQLSGKTQVPYSSDGLIGDLILNANGTTEPTRPTPSAVAENPELQSENLAELRKKRDSVTAINKHIMDLNSQLGQARQQETAGNYDEAIAILQPITRSDPGQDLIWASLGEAQLNAKKYPEAIESYQKAIAIKPASGVYHSGLADAYARSGQTEKAVLEWATAAQDDPLNAGSYYFNEGAVLTNTGKVAEAIAAFDKSLQVDPTRADAYYWKGVCLMGEATIIGNKMVAPEGTAEAFQKYLELRPNGKYAVPAKEMLAANGK